MSSNPEVMDSRDGSATGSKDMSEIAWALLHSCVAKLRWRVHVSVALLELTGNELTSYRIALVRAPIWTTGEARDRRQRFDVH